MKVLLANNATGKIMERGKKGIEILCAMAKDAEGEWFLRLWAVEALVKIGLENVGDAGAKAICMVISGKTEGLEALGLKAIPALLEMLKDEEANSVLKGRAARGLALISETYPEAEEPYDWRGVVKELCLLSGEKERESAEDREIRREAAYACKRISGVWPSQMGNVPGKEE
jgi:hypothetical protein